MNKCECGKTFDNPISCSRHKSTCAIYKKTIKKIEPKFEQEGVDHVVCIYCGYKARDLVRHLYTAFFPHPNLKQYREKYPEAKIVCSNVNVIRKRTNKVLHGDENYRNRDQQSVGIREAFRTKPEILDQIRETKLSRYGDSGYVNYEQRKKTMLARYGVDNPMKNPETVKKALETKRVLYTDNPIQRTPVIEKTTLENFYKPGVTLEDTAKELGVSVGMVSYWMKKYGLEVKRKLVYPKNKEYVHPKSIVKEYLDYCKQKNKVLSFSEYGLLTEDKKKQRIKRLFGTGKKFHFLLSSLKDVCLNDTLWENFLSNFNIGRY